MADVVKVPTPESIAQQPRGMSAWTPLREPLFRTLWIASVVSYSGTWMQNVGAGWLMTQLTPSPFMVSLVQAAMALPVFLVILPAGALADMVDRRRFLLATQGWMVLASGTLGILTLTSCMSPWVLVLFTFLLGLGAVMNDPAWQAITPEVVSNEQHAAAVALNSAGFNVARSVGPALGGAVVAATGSGWAFLLNAVSFFGVIYFLYRWKRTPHAVEHSEGVHDAILRGFRYVKGSDLAKSVLIRTGAFSIAASSMLALLPVIAQPHGPSGYGLLLASFGVGALAGAALLPRIRAKVSIDGLVAGAVVVFALATFASGRVQEFSSLCIVMVIAGLAWIGILACLNVTAQTMCPSWMRARALSMYLLVLQGGMAIGSAVWGALASRYGVPNALLGAAVALVLGLSTVKRHRLTGRDLELAPAVVRD
jgi:MFS family permease